MTAIQSKTHIKAETDNTEKTDVDGASNKTKIKYGQKMSMKESSTSDLASFEGKETSHYPDTGIANGSEKKEKRREVHVNYKSCSDDEGGGLVIDEGEDDAAEKNEKLQNADLKKPVRKRSKTGDITETDEDDSLDKELNSPKRKGIPKITDSDEDVQDNPIIKSSSASKCVQGKQLKRKSADSKLAKDEEAEKIKAMADAMKKKIEERKLESESKKAKTVSQVCTDRDKITSVKDVPSTVKTHDDKNDSSTSYQGTDKPSSSNLSSVVQDSKSTTQTLKNQTMQPPSRESSSANEPPNKESISCEQVQFGVDSILQSSEFRPRADALKGSVIETLAAQHGMSHIALPIDDNVTYHHWTLGDINALIRVKYHGFMQNQGLVHIAPKMEYQPIFGYERETLNEVAKNWASIYVRPNSSLVRCRVNAFNSEIMKIEAVQFQDLVPPESLFCPKQAFADLDMILQQIKSLSVGQYLVRNNPKKETMNIMKAVTEPDSTSYDLHLAHTTLMMSKVNKPPVVQWLPIDTRHLLPHHRKLNLIPCTFPPPDMGPVEKKKFQRKKKKKSKNKQKP
ncbi:little elongation complex subunit 2-like [Dreissena polymorpha]|uniref:little elongation complex subunit 2-like n=1 Tax=Dreissena polymorpha TaxID=45954 RepID=UPI0022640E81|nr:little elongation complex subunit 2-like [Dreissena polymorpha]